MGIPCYNLLLLTSLAFSLLRTFNILIIHVFLLSIFLVISSFLLFEYSMEVNSILLLLLLNQRIPLYPLYFLTIIVVLINFVLPYVLLIMLVLAIRILCQYQVLYLIQLVHFLMCPIILFLESSFNYYFLL